VLQQEAPHATVPLITAVVATYNEERHIRKSLTDLLNQRDVDGDVEILVVDGGSRDRTIDIIKSFPEFGSRIRLLRNPRRLQVYAWNIGIRHARGTYVTLLSAHVEYSPDFLQTSLETLERTGAANVGGVQTAVADGALGSVIAWAMQSPFGIGNSHIRQAQKPTFADHSFTFFLKKLTLEQLGGFDESFEVNEDCDLNYRLRKSGRTVYCTPDIKVKYHARSSLQGLARQMYRYGFWRRRTQLKHPEYVPWRVNVPPTLLAGLLVSAGLFAARQTAAALIVPCVYGAFLLIGAARAVAKLKRPFPLILAPIVLCTMHLSFGLGWWVGFFSHRKSQL